MSHSDVHSDPVLSYPSSLFNEVSNSVEEQKAQENVSDGEEQALVPNDAHWRLVGSEQAQGYISEQHGGNSMSINLRNGLGVDLMENNNSPGTENSNLSGEYSEQEYSGRVSEDDEISASEYSDDDYDETGMEDPVIEAEDMRSSQSVEGWEFDGQPVSVRNSSPLSPPSYSPPPTPILSLAPLFPPSAAKDIFENPIRYTTRINARKVRVHEAHLTMAEHHLRQHPRMWRRSSKIPTSLRLCWTPYDISDAHLENTLVAVIDYGAEEAEEVKGAEKTDEEQVQEDTEDNW